jgi:hypothetical protein
MQGRQTMKYTLLKGETKQTLAHWLGKFYTLLCNVDGSPAILFLGPGSDREAISFRRRVGTLWKRFTELCGLTLTGGHANGAFQRTADQVESAPLDPEVLGLGRPWPPIGQPLDLCLIPDRSVACTEPSRPPLDSLSDGTITRGSYSYQEEALMARRPGFCTIEVGNCVGFICRPRSSI